MSHSYYKELWLIARKDLDKLMELDRKLQQTKKTKGRKEGLNLLLPIYLRYRNLVKRLIVCHDQMVQTQKRDLIKQVLDCAVGRMLEYKREIVNLDYYDYQWPDNFMNEFKYTPDDVEISVSAAGKDIVEQRRERIQKLIEDAYKIPGETTAIESSAADVNESGEVQVSSRIRRRRVKEEAVSSAELPAIFQESPEEMKARKAREAVMQAMHDAILLIQCHERARVDRAIGAEVQAMYDYSKKVEAGEIVPKKLSRTVYVNAVKTIQRAWRRYTTRKWLKNRIARKEELLGMTIPSWKSRETFIKDKENFQKKLTLMPEFAKKIVKETEKEQLFKIKGPGLMEDITDEIREWFILWYDETGHFYVYPAAHLGGSVLIATGEIKTPKEYLAEKLTKEVKAEKNKPIKDAKVWISETKAFSLLTNTNRDFINNWSFREQLLDEGAKVYHDLIQNKLCYQLQLEMREAVDELMRLELNILNKALKKDYAADNRKLDIPKDKKGRRKRNGKKGRQKQDSLGNINMDNLFKELVRADIIKNYPLTSLKDWIGDLSYQNYEAAQEFREYKHRMGEVKQAVMDYCVLPLSTKEIHEVAPLIRSVCICGHPRHGKSFLVNAICSEVGALLFDMTPTALVDKYNGRKNETKLINMISKIAREYAPAIIFIDNGEKPWLRKVPMEERYCKPKRFARYYPKFVKSIKRGDQILFLTTSSEPYKAKRPFIKIHDKFIMIPLTDYNTLYMFYKDLLMKYHGVDRNIDVSTMAKLSIGIPLEYIQQAVENVLNLRRRITFKFKPLAAHEIMEEVLKYEHPKEKILSQFTKFENRTPLGRNRARLLVAEKVAYERTKKQSPVR